MPQNTQSAKVTNKLQTDATKRVSDLRNVVLNWGSFAVAAVAGLYLAPKIVASLGVTAYGVWVIVGALVGPLSLLDFGIRSAITRLLAREKALGDHARSSALASTARLLYWGASSLAILSVGLLMIGLPHWFTIPTEFEYSGRYVLLIVGAALAITLSSNLFSGILAAVRRLDLLGAAGIVQELLRVGLVLVVLWAGAGLIGLAAVTLALACARYLWQRKVALNAYPQLRLAVLTPLRADVRAILDISIFSTVIYSLATVTGQVSTYVVGAALTLQMVTFFAVGATLPTYIQAMSLPIAQNLLPQVSQLEAKGDDEGIRRLVLDTGRLGALAILPVVLSFVTRGPTFLGIWMGPEFQKTSGPVLVVLSLAAVFGLSRHVLQTVFIGAGRHRHLIVWYLSEATLTIGLSVIFVGVWGIIGVAWAVVIPSIVTASIVFPALVSRSFGVSVLDLWVQLWVRPLAALAPFAWMSWYSDRMWPATGYVGFFGQILALLPLAALGAVVFGLKETERHRLTTLINSRLVVIRRALRQLLSRD